MYVFNVATDETTNSLIEEPEETEPITHPDEIELTQTSSDDILNIIETTGPTDKPKKKKIIKKTKKKDEQDDYLTQLMEAEIPKTKLEKYEKIELDSDTKSKERPKEEIPQSTKVERKEKKSIHVEAPIAEELQPIKLKPKRPKTIEPDVKTTELPTRRLKSRLTEISYPPEPQMPVITELNSVRQNGDLSRTIEEAEETLNTKPKKFKHKKTRKDSLEKPDLEVYERYVSSSDEETAPSKYKRAEKPLHPEEPEHQTLKLGKGKKKQPEEDNPDIIKLKKIPAKPVEDVIEDLVIKHQKEEPVKTHTDKKTGVNIDLDDFKPSAFEPIESPKEEYSYEDISSDIEQNQDIKKPKITKKKKPIPEPETIQSQIVPGTPKPKDESPEKDVSFKYSQKPMPDQYEENLRLKPFDKPTTANAPDETKNLEHPITLPKPSSTEPVEKKIKLKKKSTTKPSDAAQDVTLKLQRPNEKVTDETSDDEDAVFVVPAKPKLPPSDHELSEHFELKKIIPSVTEESAAATLTLEKPEEVHRDILDKVEETVKLPEEIQLEPSVKTIKTKKNIQKKTGKQPTQQTSNDETIQPLAIIERPEEIATLTPDKTTPKEELGEPEPKSAALIEDMSKDSHLKDTHIQEQSETPLKEEEAVEQIKLKPKKSKKVKDIADEEVVIKKTKKKKDENLQQGDFTIRKPSKTKTVVEEFAEEFTIGQPKEIVDAEDETKHIILKRPQLFSKDEESVDATVQLSEVIEPFDELSEEEVRVQLGRPKQKKPESVEHIELDATISRPNAEAPTEDVAQQFTIKKKPLKKPTPVIEEHDDEFTVKKLKKKQRVIDIPGYTDTENVTFRPRSTKTKEDVDQEFKIHLDSYAEEEVSMSGKIKIKKTRPLTYSEEAGEASIKITEEYDDGEGPIIEEIDEDLSEPEDTMYDVDEPDEFSDVEELPKEVEVTLKTNKRKPQYRVEDNEEEDVSIHTVRRKQKQQATYDEDSLTLKKPPKRKPSTYLEGYYDDVQYVLFLLCLPT